MRGGGGCGRLLLTVLSKLIFCENVYFCQDVFVKIDILVKIDISVKSDISVKFDICVKLSHFQLTFLSIAFDIFINI